MISIIVPVYGCSTMLIELYYRTKDAMQKLNIDFELLLINDHSPDDAWIAIKGISEKDNRVKGINLSRNFGQHYAISAGLALAKGEWVVVMDCDLQDQPEEIEKLYNKVLKGFDVVMARRVQRKDSFLKRLGSKYFYKILAYLTDTEQNPEIANFGIYHKKVIDAILSMNDKVKYFPAMVRWVGFKQTAIEVEHAERRQGDSSYNVKALFRLALNTILSFSDKPLRLVIKGGALISTMSIIYAIYTIIKLKLGLITEPGYSSIIISIWFLAGAMFMVLGMLGLYLGRTFEQVKDRPVFIVSEKINCTDD